MKLSIVTTLYQSEPFIQEFYERITKSAKQITEDYEIIFVNDGSPDNSLAIAIAIHQADSKVSIVDLSRNFGHHKAMMTGLNYAIGEHIFLIDVDLEEEPELLESFYSDIVADKDIDVIYGVQKSRNGSLFKKISGNIFYKLFNKASEEQIPVNLLTIRLMSQRYVNALVEHKEQLVFMAGLLAITGFNQKAVTVDKKDKGESTYSLIKRVSLLVDAITSFSSKPLIFIFYIGCFVSIISFSFATWLMIKKIVFGVAVSGWTSVVVSIWMLGGMTLFCLGIISIYLSKVFIETKNRPYTLVRHEYSTELSKLK